LEIDRKDEPVLIMLYYTEPLLVLVSQLVSASELTGLKSRHLKSRCTIANDNKKTSAIDTAVITLESFQMVSLIT
jgi:hypothetical protein